MDGKFPIDASGELTNGTTFSGSRELKQVLKSDKRFVRSLTQKMMTYALGRGLEYYDKCACDDVIARAAKEGNRFSALVMGIVTSDPFLKRKAEIARQ
jgi:rRNA-processing protein FCF1